MKKLCLILSVILCMMAVTGNITAFADTDDDKVLTLEEAKALALENDEEFSQQQRYIEQANDNYENVYDENTGSIDADLGSMAEEAEYIINRKIKIENAALQTRLAVFNRNDIERSSNYDVTVAYYDVVKSYYEVENSKIDVALKEKSLNEAKNKYDLGLITKSSLTDAENAYDDAVSTYDDAFYDMQSYMNDLSRLIGRRLDINNDKLDTSINEVDISTIDLNKMKEDYMKNSYSYYNAKEELSIAEYKLDLFQEQYDYFYKKLSNPNTSKTINEMDDMLLDAQKDYDSEKYSFDELEADLDDTLANQYRSIMDQNENYEELKKELEESNLTIEQDLIKYQMGLITKAEKDSGEADVTKLKNNIQTAMAELYVQYVNITQYSTVE